MTLQQRDLLHSHKRRHVARAAAADKEPTTAVTDKATATATTATAKTTALVLTKISLPLTTSAKTSATVTSTTATSVTGLTTSSTTSASLPSTTSTSSTTSAAPVTTTTPVVSDIPKVLSTTPSLPTTSASNTIALSSSETSAVASPSATVTPNSGIGTGTILGVVAGVVGGLLVLGLVVAFFLRRLRKKHNDRNAFDSAQFRRSAVAIPEKDDEKAGLRPRPPSMIERKNIAAQSASSLRSLPAPSMTYPYSDRASMAPSAPASSYGSDHGHQNQHYAPGGGAHYTAVPQAPPAPYNNAIPGAYGVPPPLAPYNGAQYDQAGFGAPPIPGTYGPGAYASYGADPRYPQQYPHQQQGQGYPQYSSYQQQGQGQPQFAPPPPQQQQMYGYARGPAPQPGQQPNAFARAASTSPSPEPASPAPFSDLVDAPVGHRRQPTQSSGAPPAYEADADAERRAAMRDQKIRPQDNMAVRNGAASSTATASVAARPLSSHTLYDDGDAYGGM